MGPMLAQDASPAAKPEPLGRDLLAIAVCSLIWGTTWFAITLQLGKVDPNWSVIYRFTLAAAALFGWLALKRRRMGLSRAQHLAALGQGLFTFTLDYALVYAAEQRVPSGVVAISFAALSLTTLVLFRVVLRRRASPAAWGGALLGMAGVALLFIEQLAGAQIPAKVALGLTFAVIGPICTSDSDPSSL